MSNVLVYDSMLLVSDLAFYVQQQVGDTIDVCVEDETVNYLNRQDVQKALHARLVGVRKWAVCSRFLFSNESPCLYEFEAWCL